jgi:polyhydroxyalkanoate synthesis regulator phasin
MFTALTEAEQRRFAASNPMASIIKGKTRIAEEQIRMEKERTAYLLKKVSELQTLLTEAKQVNANMSRNFATFTKIELRHLMTSSGPAKEIIDELVARGVSELALERSRGLSNEDMYKLYCEHPDVSEEFKRNMKEALVNYKLLCKDSYMQALREVEKDCKVWLEFQKELLLKAVGTEDVLNVGGWIENVTPSPAARALQRPMIWTTPNIPRDPAKAVEKVKDAGEKARASLEGMKKRTQELDMDKVYF